MGGATDKQPWDGRGLGSGKHGQPLDAVLCANSSRCDNQGTKICARCRLVAYCSKDCQKQHWGSAHKLLCKSHLMDAHNWTPAEVGLSSLLVEEPTEEMLLGNMPANGVLGPLPVRPAHLRLCFAASGDLRNIIETVCELDYDAARGKQVTIHVNDKYPKIAVRNYLMLELLRLHGEEAIDAVIALWYSVALTRNQLDAAMDVAEQALRWPGSRKEDGGSRKMVYSHSSSFEGRPNEDCLVATFSQEALRCLKSLRSNGMPLAQVQESRRRVMEGRPVLVNRRLGCMRPAHRVSWHRFRETGLVLPLGGGPDPRAMDQANRFLLAPGKGWALGDGRSDPLNGWDRKQVVETGVRLGVPCMDLYGCLHFHLRSKLLMFLRKWERCSVSIVLTDMDASSLAEEFRRRGLAFNRIETSNIADEQYVGAKGVLRDWGPLLCAEGSPLCCNSILVTSFMNWSVVYSAMERSKVFVDPAVTAQDMKRAIDKARGWGGEGWFNETLAQLSSWGELDWYRYFLDYSKAFDEYLEMVGALEIADTMGLQRRKRHELVPPRLFVPVGADRRAAPSDVGSNAEDFYLHVALDPCHTLLEAFVEWGLPLKKF